MDAPLLKGVTKKNWGSAPNISAARFQSSASSAGLSKRAMSIGGQDSTVASKSLSSRWHISQSSYNISSGRSLRHRVSIESIERSRAEDYVDAGYHYIEDYQIMERAASLSTSSSHSLAFGDNNFMRQDSGSVGLSYGRLLNLERFETIRLSIASPNTDNEENDRNLSEDFNVSTGMFW